MQTYQFKEFEVTIKRDRENKLGATAYIDLNEQTEEGAKFLRLSAHKSGSTMLTHAYVIYKEQQGDFAVEKFTMFQDFRTTYGAKAISRVTEKVMKEYFETVALEETAVKEVLEKAKAHYA